MGPVRGNAKKRKVEKKADENSMVSGSSEESTIVQWEVLSKISAGNPSSQLPDTFKSTFKVSRKTFEYICSLVRQHMTSRAHFSFTNGKPMLLTDQVAMALTRLGSGNSLVSVGESFKTHQSTVSQVTWRFVEAMEENGLHHLQWPSSQRESSEIRRKFENIRGLPNCCGAIDTTHITMLLTSSDPEADTWRDRSSNHSMLLQVVVDPDLKFRDIVTGWPGKMSRPSVLRSSSFFRLCQKGERLNGNEEYIIGDSGFPLLPWLVTPYQGKDLSESELEFNKRLLATQLVAKKALARLKAVWRMIQGVMWRPDRHKLPRFILVCCVLHNIMIDMEGNKGWEEISSTANHDPGYREEVCGSVDNAGLDLRDKLSMYFSGR